MDTSSHEPARESVPQPSPAASEIRELQRLLEESIALSQKIVVQNRQIKRRLTWMAVGSFLRILVILIPLILAAIFLPPLIEPAIRQYQELIGLSSSLRESGVNGQVMTDLLQMLR